jgi:hypothetical protein
MESSKEKKREWLTGLKINFHKSEVFVFGVSKEKKRE